MSTPPNKALPMLAALLLAGLTAASAGAAQPAPPVQRLEHSSWTTFQVRPDPVLKDPLEQRGREVFQARCNLCHGDYPKDIAPGIPPMAGTQMLALKYKGAKPALLEQRTDLTPQQVAYFVRHGVGFMPFFRPTEVTDDELAALGAYHSRKRR